MRFGSIFRLIVLMSWLAAIGLPPASAESPGRLDHELTRLAADTVQQTPLPENPVAAQPAAKAPDGADLQMHQLEIQLDQYKFKNFIALFLTIVVVAFGFCGFLIMWKAVGATASPDQFLRSCIGVFIVIASLILITAGFTTEQIAPAFGLFGTIVGYMLGRLNQSTSNSADPLHPGPAGTVPPPADVPNAQPPNQAANTNAN